MSIGQELLNERRRRRRAGDPRLSDADREILLRITTGDLAPAFQAALDADVVGDPVLGGHVLALLSDAGRDGIRHPHPEVLSVLDPRPLLDDAAELAARYGGGLLIAETLAAGLVHGRRLFFGTAR